MRSFVFLILTLNTPSTFATLLKGRIVDRNSVFCASLFTATRALSIPDSASEGAKAFRDFREQVLNAAPVLTDGPVAALRVHSESSPKYRDALVRRVYSAERSFSAPAMNDEFVVATATLDARDYDRLVQNVGAARDQFFAEAKRSDNANIRRFAIHRYVANLNEYYFYGSFFAWLAFKSSFLTTYISALWLFDDPIHPRALAAFGSMVILAGVGAFDYPVRHVRSFQLGFQTMAKALKKFREGTGDWTYWSRDITVSPEFAQSLLAGHTVDWDQTLRDEDFREESSGAYRLWRDRQRKAEGRRYVNFSVDVLARRIDGEPRMTIVLRSQPVPTPQTAAKPVPNLVGAEAL